MCIAIPAKVKKADGHNSVVAVNSMEKEISLCFTPEAKKGDWVIVHAGFAIKLLDKAEAFRILYAFDDLK